jgi:hypothetical protein
VSTAPLPLRKKPETTLNGQQQDGFSTILFNQDFIIVNLNIHELNIPTIGIFSKPLSSVKVL